MNEFTIIICLIQFKFILFRPIAGVNSVAVPCTMNNYVSLFTVCTDNMGHEWQACKTSTHIARIPYRCH